MNLTPENKQIIDNKSYHELLQAVRYSPIGDPWFQGETGEYWMKRMSEVRNMVGHAEHVATSKAIGWD